ncbi:MAG: Asp-tRNA(Asn)/Glu-tRNA(Gln) amidotransferase subunit GatB [Candidatus Aenigmarchaeota archaeon]|nr:Asp-tRNA(Asn)/Glu-tRNA(Gln) amidotransferase subunit GatB [Candidatus Aenigmarchaeota archaeon]
MRIGLEVHVQLRTRTKLFCGCPNTHEEKPNMLTCEYCLGMPGSKPVLNTAAVDAAIKIGLALNCAFPKEMFFSRKSYFYPDMGKNFQITQYEAPVASKGIIEAGGKKAGITRVQMEEDPARIVHEKTHILVDYNRSGVPLCEIVTEPDFGSPKEARVFLQHLASVLEYLGVMDPSMEGSMRVDANVSTESNRVEIKNITGFKEVERALNYEIIRQRNVIRRGHEIKRETRGWDADAGVTRSQRSKEEEDDYGYIFEIDLPRITLPKAKIDSIRQTLPELAGQKMKRYAKMGVKEELAKAITSEIDLAQAFEKVAENVEPALAAKWFAGEIKKTLNYNDLRMKDTGITTQHVSKLLIMVRDGKLTDRAAEMIFRGMVERPQDPEKLAAGMQAIGSEGEIESLAKEAINENPKAIEDYNAGKKESFNFLVGQVMKKTKGRAKPDAVKAVMEKLLGK